MSAWAWRRCRTGASSPILPSWPWRSISRTTSIAIEPASYRTIGLIADALHDPRLRHYKFLVVGHTNATGKAEHNLELSMKRADAIVVALTTTFSVPASHLIAIGVGQEMPLDATNPKAAANRRVQLINLGLAN